MRVRTGIGVALLSVLALVAGVVLYAYSHFTSPLQLLTVLNPRNAGNANLTPSAGNTNGSETEPIPPDLTATPVEVPTGLTSPFGTRTLFVPAGYHVSLFTVGLNKPRLLAVGPDGTVMVSEMGAGHVVALPDADHNGVADRVVVFASGLNRPHGLAFRDGWWYVGETGKVERFRDTNGDLVSDERSTVVPNLPDDGGHFTRTLAFDSAGKLYVSIGSSCNVCDDDSRRAAVLRFNADGSGEELFASGLRNSVGIVFRPGTEELWGTDNGRDLLGDDIPPDELNHITLGANYGWPNCYDGRIVDPHFNRADRCPSTVPPVVSFQAHSAPLGMRFLSNVKLPNLSESDLLVAFHGSWNRRVPTGYKLVRVRLGDSPTVSDFATGWFVGTKAWGRPVDMIVAPDGSLLVTDDYAGVVYRIST
jgi:glucose/arabinose dehydrogenase